jgi:hypothetical protein
MIRNPCGNRDTWTLGFELLAAEADVAFSRISIIKY